MWLAAALAAVRGGPDASCSPRRGGPIGSRSRTSSGRSSSLSGPGGWSSLPAFRGPARRIPSVSSSSRQVAPGSAFCLCADGEGGAAMCDLTGHDAVTIHRALALLAQRDRFLRDERRPALERVELVIVDEASMLSLELADALFRAAGDCHVLLVGDTDQLPPIGPGRVLADLVDSEGRARPPDRDLPAGCSLPHRPQRPPHQRRPPAVPLARRGARRARPTGARRGLRLDLAQRPRNPAGGGVRARLRGIAAAPASTRAPR